MEFAAAEYCAERKYTFIIVNGSDNILMLCLFALSTLGTSSNLMFLIAKRIKGIIFGMTVREVIKVVISHLLVMTSISVLI